MKRKIACVGISKRRKQEFQGKGIEILEAKFMLEELLSLIREHKKLVGNSIVFHVIT